MNDREEIEVVFHEDAAAEAAALGWYQRTALAPWERWLRCASGYLILLAVSASAGMAVSWITGGARDEAVAVAFIVAALGLILWPRWAARLLRQIKTTHDVGGWGTMRYRFDATGVTYADDLRRWRSDWRGISRVEMAPAGLFIAGKGTVFFLPAGCWAEAGERTRDGDQVIGWWHGATGALA